jgi:hypothetical protein
VAEPGGDLLRDHHPAGHPGGGTPGSVSDLIAAIRRFIDDWNDRCEPFTWTRAGDEILDHAKPRKRKVTSFTRP